MVNDFIRNRVDIAHDLIDNGRFDDAVTRLKRIKTRIHNDDLLKEVKTWEESHDEVLKDRLEKIEASNKHPYDKQMEATSQYEKYAEAYLSYYDNNANANLSKYKYLSAVSGLDDTAFRNKKGYWIYSNVSGNLTLPSVGGSTSGQSYYVSELRFSNGSLEKTYLNAIIADWIEIPQYRDTDTNSFQVVTGNLNSWQGYFFKSNIDNLTLIRQN